MLRDVRITAVLTLLALAFIRSSHSTSLGVGAAALFAQSGQNSNTTMITITDDSKPRFHPGRVLVRFKGEATARTIPTPNPMSAIARYRADNSVLYAEPDYVVSVY